MKTGAVGRSRTDPLFRENQNYFVSLQSRWSLILEPSVASKHTTNQEIKPERSFKLNQMTVVDGPEIAINTETLQDRDKICKLCFHFDFASSSAKGTSIRWWKSESVYVYKVWGLYLHSLNMAVSIWRIALFYDDKETHCYHFLSLRRLICALFS